MIGLHVKLVALAAALGVATVAATLVAAGAMAPAALAGTVAL
jgi:hypothetical protein